ncbi:MAG: hypothetical protein ACREPT_12640 [Rudaea sp.]
MLAGKAPGFLSARTRCARAAPLAFGVALLVSIAAHADHKDSYARGLEAYKAGHLAEAKQLLTEARDEHPEPAVRVRLYGQRFEPYLPQHYLGLIAIQQGDCAGARAQWSSAGNQDVVSQLADLANEEKSSGAKCGALAQAKPGAPPAVPAPPATPTKTVAGKPPASAPAAAETQKQVAATESPPPAVPGKPNDVAQVKPAAPADRPVGKPVVADKAAPPEQLVQVFENFLSGRLPAVSRINPDAYSEARARFHAYLVRCDARYTLAQVNGDRALLESARADAHAAHALNASANPDPVLFSPHFRSFYAENR